MPSSVYSANSGQLTQLLNGCEILQHCNVFLQHQYFCTRLLVTVKLN